MFAVTPILTPTPASVKIASVKDFYDTLTSVYLFLVSENPEE